MRTYFWQDADAYAYEVNASDETPTDTGAASSTSLESSTPVWRAQRCTRMVFVGETMDEWIARQNLRQAEIAAQGVTLESRSAEIDAAMPALDTGASRHLISRVAR